MSAATGEPRGRVLIVAASDSGGGAGIQADLKTVLALGGYGMTAISGLTAQNTRGIFGTYPVPPEFVALQMRVVLEDLGADAIKIGVLGSAEIIEAVAEVLESPLAQGIPVILDPVMVAKDGTRFLDFPGMDAIRRCIAPRAALLSPNVPEAEALTGYPIRDLDGMRHAAEILLTLGADHVLVTGGHLPGPEIVDILVGGDEEAEFRHPRVDTQHTHGTGCTLTSAIAACVAQGQSFGDAVDRAHRFVYDAIRAAPGFGAGYGPLGHGAAA